MDRRLPARFLLLAIGIFAFLQLGANPAALLIGLSIAMPAVLIDAWINRPEPVDPTQLPALDPDDEAWDRWSVWRVAEVAPREDADEASFEPLTERTGRSPAWTRLRDDLNSTAAVGSGGRKRAHWARVDAAREEDERDR